MIDSKKRKLFCYRDLKSISPYYKRTTSTFHFDVDNEPIEDLLPHCPICDHEVIDWDYHNHVLESKRRIYNDYLRAHGVISFEV